MEVKTSEHLAFSPNYTWKKTEANISHTTESWLHIPLEKLVTSEESQQKNSSKQKNLHANK